MESVNLCRVCMNRKGRTKDCARCAEYRARLAAALEAGAGACLTGSG